MARGEVLVSSQDRSDIRRNAGVSLFPRGGTAKAMERLENLSDEVTEGRSSARVDEDGVERGGWMMNN